METLREGGPKNPTLFGSIGEERRQFFRTARRWMSQRSSAPADPSSSTPQQSFSQPPNITLISSFEPAAGTLPAVSSYQGPPGDGLAVPFVSVTGPTPTPSPRESRMPAVDPNPSGSSGSAIDGISPMTSGKRKKDMESEDESPPNESGPRSILLRRKESPFPSLSSCLSLRTNLSFSHCFHCRFDSYIGRFTCSFILPPCQAHSFIYTFALSAR